MSYSNKEKLHYFQRLQNSEASEHDLALLSTTPDANIDKYTRSPRRYADDILYALLELFPVSIIVRNRREWARREADELKAKDGEGTGVDKTETKDGEGTGVDKTETKDGEGTGADKTETKDGEGTGADKTETKDGEGTGVDKTETKDGEGTEDTKPSAPEEPGTEKPESTGSGDESVEESPSAPEEPGTEEPESTGTGDESVEESPSASEEPGTEEPESTETDDSKKVIQKEEEYPNIIWQNLSDLDVQTATIIYNDRINTYHQMKQLDIKLEKKPSAQHVQELAECRIRNLQAFAELQSYNDNGKFLNKHPLLFGRSEFSTLKKLFETDPAEFLRQHKNVLDNIKRYKCFMKRASRKDKKASDKQHLEQHQERERLFRLVLEQKSENMEKLIEVYNLGSLPTAPLDSFLELQEDFKKSDPDKLSKLQMLILTRGFKYSFKAWRDADGKLWIIDAHQRRKALLALRKSGFIIPEIPYEPIQAETKQEAVEEIAAYNSEFATKNPDTILFQKYKIDTDTLGRFNLGYEVKNTDFSDVGAKLFENDSQMGDIVEDSGDLDLGDTESSVFAMPGDVYRLGNNRLMCGDCRSKDDIVVLMNGHYANMLLTDPPYNVNYEGGDDNKLKIQNDSMENDTFSLFLHQVFSLMFAIVKPGGSFYVFHADSEGENFRKSLRETGFKIAQCCVWVKDSLVMGRQDYQWQHEPCLYGWKPGSGHYWNTDRKQTTVWNFDKPHASKIHPTMKPIALMAYPIVNSSKNGDIVADFFSGSGSTIMACQQTDRIGYGMEVDPRYVSASVKRYMAMFPSQPIQLERGGKLLTLEETKNIILCQQN